MTTEGTPPADEGHVAESPRRNIVSGPWRIFLPIRFHSQEQTFKLNMCSHVLFIVSNNLDICINTRGWRCRSDSASRPTALVQTEISGFPLRCSSDIRGPQDDVSRGFLVIPWLCLYRQREVAICGFEWIVSAAHRWPAMKFEPNFLSRAINRSRL